MNSTSADRRYYTYNQYLQYKGINTENCSHQTIIYAKVSTKKSKDDCRLYGLRKYKKRIREDKEIAEELQDRNQSNKRTESKNQ